MLEASLARLMDLMAAFSKERAASCPIGRWDLSVIVETQGSCEDVDGAGAGHEEESEPLMKTSVNLASRAWCEQTYLMRDSITFTATAFTYQ